MFYDAIVIGLGSTGGATFCHLAKKGVRVLGIDAASPPHDGGSSHGHTRIYRQAYYEAAEYVPLAVRALDLWRELERETSQTLFVSTGALMIGPEHGELVAGAVESARQHGIAYEMVSHRHIAGRFPAFVAPKHTVGVFEPTAGVLMVDRCLAAHIDLGRRAGGEVHVNEKVLGVEQHADGVSVRTNQGMYNTARVVVAAGAWSPALLDMSHAFRVTREVVHWFKPQSQHASAPSCPVSMIQFDDGPIFYSIPDFGHGFKAGLHHAGLETNPDAPGDLKSDADRVATLMRELAPGAAGPLINSAPCYYTTTRDHHFSIGALPNKPDVFLASACSGHGFKFAPALGEHLAALVTDSSTDTYAIFDVGRMLK